MKGVVGRARATHGCHVNKSWRQHDLEFLVYFYHFATDSRETDRRGYIPCRRCFFGPRSRENHGMTCSLTFLFLFLFFSFFFASFFFSSFCVIFFSSLLVSPPFICHISSSFILKLMKHGTNVSFCCQALLPVSVSVSFPFPFPLSFCPLLLFSCPTLCTISLSSSSSHAFRPIASRVARLARWHNLHVVSTPLHTVHEPFAGS